MLSSCSFSTGRLLWGKACGSELFICYKLLDKPPSKEIYEDGHGKNYRKVE